MSPVPSPSKKIRDMLYRLLCVALDFIYLVLSIFLFFLDSSKLGILEVIS